MGMNIDGRWESFINTVLICGVVILIAQAFDTSVSYFVGVGAICTIIGLAERCFWYNTCPNYQCIIAVVSNVYLAIQCSYKLGQSGLISIEEIGNLCRQPIGIIYIIAIAVIAYAAIRLMLRISKLLVISFLLSLVLPESKSAPIYWTSIKSSDIQV